MRFLVSATLALCLTACSDEGAPEGTAEAQNANSRGVGVQTLAAPAAPDVHAATLDLQATGLTIPPQRGEEQLELPFGSNRAAAEATIASLIGVARERFETAECGAGPMQMTQYDGLLLYFQEGRLVGYYAGPPFVPQASRAEMLTNASVELLEQSTLGEEFTIGDPAGAVISGLFDGAGDNAAVEALWAGTTCVFR